MTYSISNLISELSKYGISSSGNIQVDLTNLNEAKKAQGESTVDESSFLSTIKQMEKNKEADQIKEENSPSVPWSGLLQSLGLSASSSKEEDFANIRNKIAEMKKMDLSPSQKANLDSLYAQYQSYYDQYS